MSKAQRPIDGLPDDTARFTARQVDGLENTVNRNFTARSVQILSVAADDTQFGLAVGSSARPRIPQMAVRSSGGTWSLYVRVAPETRVAGVVTVLGVWKSCALT